MHMAKKTEKRLHEYRARRDPRHTPEPFGVGRSKGDVGFVVQRHQARRLHYDLRLERGGVLQSWAVPKGIPLEPGRQHLAVHVEDHPLEYATFEGEIPKGEYGAGRVEIWDRGTYELVEEKRDGGLTVRLHGDRLEGTWALVPAGLSGDEKNWLLLRKRDDQVSESLRRAYEPMLATLERELPRGKGWLYEVKFDGYRALAYLRGGDVELRSRTGNDLTQRFSDVARAIEAAVKTPDCVLDGEICALDDQGRPSFSAMQKGEAGTPIVFYAFDVLEVDREPLVELSLAERHRRLAQLIDRRRRGVRLSETFTDGAVLLQVAEEQGLEGVVAKREDSRYQVGRRTRDWLKIKTHGRQEFLVAGYTRGQGRRATTFGALVLAVRKGEELVYTGNVGTGFTERTIEQLLQQLRPLERDTSPFAEPPKMPKVRRGDVIWVEPRLVVEIEFVEWTHEGRLRAPSFVGMREDKQPEDVQREEPLPLELRRGKRVLKLSNLDKVFWPDERTTKGDLLAYYRRIAPVLVPHLKNRPFTMKRYPDGIAGGHFFQKDAPSHMPDWIPTRAYRSTSRESREKRTIRYPLVNDDLALLWMANMGCIDLNTWYSRVDKPDRPDFVLFDLDPSPDVGFPEVVQVALLVKQALDALGLEGFAKTSGSDGMHVLVPIARRSTYDDTREFAEIVARALAAAHRGLVTTEWSKAKRRGVLIDANQNGEGKTIASVYSVRPHLGAPVSTPLSWDEVNGDLDPAVFTMDAVSERIERRGDLFAPALSGKQSLAGALKALR